VRRFLVTGGTGFLGQALVRKLPGPSVVLVRDRETHVMAGSKGHPEINATLCFGDLSSMEAIARIIADYRVDTVIHLAAQTEIGVGFMEPLDTFRTNVEGTWNVLEACRRIGGCRVIVAASDKSYGRTLPPYREDQPLTPDRPYETSKACADMIARTYAATYDMSVAVTRCTNLYGPGCLTLSTLIPNTVRRLLRGESPIVREGGRMTRDWLYVDDAVDGYLKLIESPYVGAVNFGGGKAVSVIDTVKLIKSIMQSNVEIVTEPDKHGEIIDQFADCTLAKCVLGWEPKFDLESGLRETVAWYRENLK
jgi:CDP-glucose 4,6-dehydratase